MYLFFMSQIKSIDKYKKKHITRHLQTHLKHTHTHTHTHADTHTHTHTHNDTHTQTHTCIHTRTHKRNNTHKHTNRHTNTQIIGRYITSVYHRNGSQWTSYHLKPKKQYKSGQMCILVISGSKTKTMARDVTPEGKAVVSPSIQSTTLFSNY